MKERTDEKDSGINEESSSKRVSISHDRSEY